MPSVPADKNAAEPRITAQESREVLSELECVPPPAKASHSRRLRVPYGSRKIQIELDETMGRKTSFYVQGRNLSSRGIAVLHAQFIHTGRQCTVRLPTVDGGAMIAVPGSIRRCRLVRGRTHEIAIAFDKSIDLSEFVPLTGSQRREFLTEASQDPSLGVASAPKSTLPITGANVLVVEDFEASRDLYAFWLTKAGLKPFSAGSNETAARVLADSRIDVILMDVSLVGGQNGLDLVKKLRAQKVAIPVICITADGSDERRAAALDAGCTDVLVKPFDREELILAIQSSLTEDPYSPLNKTPIKTTIKVEQEMLPLLQKFADQARTLADMLRSALESSNHAEMEKICRRLADTGKNFGFAPVAEVGRGALQSMQQEAVNVARVRREIERVISVLNRIEA